MISGMLPRAAIASRPSTRGRGCVQPPNHMLIGVGVDGALERQRVAELGLRSRRRMTERVGLDPHDSLGIIDGRPLGATYAQVKGRMMIDRSYAASFPLRLAHRDAVLAIDAAIDAGA
jgi:hypothetical protein